MPGRRPRHPADLAAHPHEGRTPPSITRLIAPDSSDTVHFGGIALRGLVFEQIGHQGCLVNVRPQV